MNKEEFVKIMTYLGVAYGKQFNKEELTVWYSIFYKVNIDVFKIAIRSLIEKSKFLPSISELKNEILKLENPELKLDAEIEWGEVLNAIKKFGYYQSKEALESLKPYTRKIVEKIGFQKICLSENINWERKNFIETFNAFKKKKFETLIESNNEKLLIEKRKL